MAKRNQAKSRVKKDEKATREQLLEAASEVFARRGFDRATGKEICKKARANGAAINYHFGGMDGLYVAVIRDAHNRLATVEELSAAVEGAHDPKEKLRAVMNLFAQAITGPLKSSRFFRVLGREILHPSPALKKLDETLRLPKARIVKKIVADVLGVRESHPAVAHASISVMAPCLMMLIAEPVSIKRIFPNIKIAGGDSKALADHLTRFALAGLKAVGVRTHVG
jgi:AcrR family transcriptional regulator